MGSPNHGAKADHNSLKGGLTEPTHLDRTRPQGGEMAEHNLQRLRRVRRLGQDEIRLGYLLAQRE